MFKRLLILTSLLSLKAAAVPSMQLIVPENNYAIISNGKTLQTLLDRTTFQRPTSSTSIAQDEEEESNDVNGDVVASGEATLDTESQQSDDSDAAAASYASAKATVRSTLALSAVSQVATTSVQHHVVSPETIPLPLKITTRPGLRTIIAPETITIQEPTIAKIGEVVQQIPTAVSHQSQTVVHKHASVVTPIVAPAVRTIQSQVLRAYQTPLVYGQFAPSAKVDN